MKNVLGHSERYMKYSNENKKSKKTSAIDLFCGAGGLTHGLEKAGIDVSVGIDNDPLCQYPYEKNNNAKFILKPIEAIESKDIESFIDNNSVNIMAGCAPCQTFSTYNQKSGPSDKRWWLISHFERLIREIKPEIVTMENVPRLIKQEIFNQFVKSLIEIGYQISYKIVKCDEYGIPQKRNRLVLMASIFGTIDLIDPIELKLKSKTVRDSIGSLPPIGAGEIDKNDPLHQSSKLSELNLKRMISSTPGGTWKDWDEKLRADCHIKKSGKSYSGVYGRMCWDEPSPTITTQFYGFGNGRFGHPEQNRALSLREGAILQTFPKKYKFYPSGEPIHMKSLGRMIGNAVPVKLGEVIGKSILRHLHEHI